MPAFQHVLQSVTLHEKIVVGIMFIMNITDIQKQEFIDIISSERLNSYKTIQEETFAILLERYMYNIKVAESFYPILSILEIALRNKIHNSIDKLIKSDWLLSEIYKQDLLLDNEHKILMDTFNKLKFKDKNLTKGALISELTFGFWVNLCKKSYKTILWDKKGFFESVFPFFSIKKEMNKIRFISPDLKNILQLRNRIFHHEIIINHKIGIENCYDKIEKILLSISEDSLSLLTETCKFRDIIKQKP